MTQLKQAGARGGEFLPHLPFVVFRFSMDWMAPTHLREVSVPRGVAKSNTNLSWKKILTYVTTGMNHEDIILWEICLSEKDKYCIISLP